MNIMNMRMKRYSFDKFSETDIEKIHSIFFSLDKKFQRGNLEYKYPIFPVGHRTATPDKQKEILLAVEKEYGIVIIDASKEFSGFFTIQCRNSKEYLNWWRQLQKKFKGVLHYDSTTRVLKYYDKEIILKENKTDSVLDVLLLTRPKFSISILEVEQDHSANSWKVTQSIIHKYRKYIRRLNKMAVDKLSIHGELIRMEKDKLILNTANFREIFVL